MQQPGEIWRGVVLLAALAGPAPLAGQVVLTSDAGAFNNYTWRGVTLTNKLVVQPDAYLTVPAGGGAAVLGAWGNIDAGRYDDPVNELSEGGGTAGFDATEIDVWAEYGHPLGSTFTGTLGGLLYLFPNEAGLTNEVNRTFEVYGKLQATGFPLAPKVAAYLDVAKVNGLYLETSVSPHPGRDQRLPHHLRRACRVERGPGGECRRPRRDRQLRQRRADPRRSFRPPGRWRQGR